MARKAKAPSPASTCDSTDASSSRVVTWKFTKSMNMRDLSRDDDYLSHIFIEKLGNLSAKAPIVVHKMDPLRRLPKTDPMHVLSVVHRLIRAKPSGPVAVKQAVNELLSLHAVQYFLRDYDEGQINAFATHASRYLELYLPSGSIEIAQTSRYSKWTGKSELCIVATRQMVPGFLIAELKGSMADLTEEEDRELKRTGPRNDGGTRRDFSVIHSKQLKKNHLFLGPARFVNHDCENNAVLFRSGRYITFRAIKPIAPGQEITAHYGDGYFGKNNRHCLCESCERKGKGGYAPQTDEDILPSPGSDEDSEDGLDSDSDTASILSSKESDQTPAVNLNERRTRRGVYLVLPESQANSDCSEDEAEDKTNAVPSPPLDRAETATLDGPSHTTSRESSLTSKSKSPSLKPQKGPYTSLVSTRGQKAREASLSSISQLQTPPQSGSCSDTATRSSSRTLRNRKSEPIPQPTSLSAASAPRPRGRPRKVLETDSPRSSPPTQPTDADSRSLRARKSMPVVSAKKGDIVASSSGVKTVEPSVPICVTCSIPLPQIAEADSSKSRKGKSKDEKEECSRCRRHFLIYNAPWPQRTPIPGSSFIPTPRECTPADNSLRRLSHSNLKGLDKKLKVVFNANKRAREDEFASAAAKKRKVTPPEITPQREGVRVSSRKRVPAAKVLENSGPVIKSEFVDTINLSSVLDSKRSGAGQKRSREAEPVESRAQQQPITEGLRLKRGRRSAPEAVSVSVEEVVDDEMDDEDDRRDKSFWPCLPLPAYGLGAKHLGLLNVRPNPCRISRWRSSYGSSESTPTLVDDDTDDNASDIHPSTPPDNIVAEDVMLDDVDEDLSRPSLVEPDAPPNSEPECDIEIENVLPPKLTVSTIGLFSRPNPGELAKRMWAPSIHRADSAGDETRTPQRPSRLGSPLSSPESTRYLRTKLGPALNLHPKSSDSNLSRDNVTSTSPIFITNSAVAPSNGSFKLQALSTFIGHSNSSSPSPIGSPTPSRNITSEEINNLRSPFTPFNSITASPGAGAPRDVTPRSNRLRELSPSLHVLGPFHSDFAASPSTAAKTKPSLVHAGWESDAY